MLRTAVLAGGIAMLCGCPSSPPPVNHPPPPPTAPAASAPRVQQQRFVTPVMPTASFADAGRADRARAVLAKIDGELAAKQKSSAGYPALAVGVVLDGELIWHRGYGQRTPGGGVVDQNTVFRTGSITKVFTGAAVLRLRDLGRLSLDRPAHDYLRELGHVRYPSGDDEAITLRHLLTHTSGLARNVQVFAKEGTALTRGAALGGLDGFVLQTSPLRVFRYSNLGVGLAGLIVGDRAGKPYRHVIRDSILTPLGMTSSVWDGAAAGDRLATGHKAGGQAIALTDHLRIGPTEGSGGLYSTVADLARFTAMQLAAWPPRSGPDPYAAILKRSSVRESHTMLRFVHMRARVDGGGKLTTNVNGVGIAWQVQESCDLDHLVWHNGATIGYTAALMMQPQRGLGVIMFANNRRSVTGLARKTLARLVDEARLGTRVQPVGPSLATIAKGPVGAILKSGELTRPTYEALFDDNFRQAIAFESMEKLHRDTKKKHGACRPDGWLEVKNAREGWMRARCEASGDLAIKIGLSWNSPARISLFRVTTIADYRKGAPKRAAKPRCIAPTPAADKADPDS